MKKALLGILLCLSLAVFGFSGGFSIKLNGGANFLMGGDYNKIVEDAEASWRSVPGLTYSGGFDKLSMGWNFGAEFVYNFSDQMGVGLGVGYITASNDSTFAAISGPAQVTGRFAPSLSVIPITLNFHYLLPLSDMFKINFSVGPGLYISSLDLTAQQQLGSTSDPGVLIDMTANFTPDGVMGFGFQGGLGFEIAFSPSVSFCVDILGRMASLSGFTGAWTVTGHVLWMNVNDSGTGTFYYYESGGYAGYEIGTSIPSGSGISNAREASISLSGVCAMAGIKINI